VLRSGACIFDRRTPRPVPGVRQRYAPHMLRIGLVVVLAGLAVLLGAGARPVHRPRTAPEPPVPYSSALVYSLTHRVPAAERRGAL